MFGFGKGSPGPLRDARSAERWLAALPGRDPVAIQRAVVTELRKLEERTVQRTPSKLEAVFVVDAGMIGVAKSLTEQYIEHATRSPKIEHQLWGSLFELTHGFQTCYAAFARDIPDHDRRDKWSPLLPVLIARQIIHLYRDTRIRLYRNEPWIPVKWAELHAPFTRACAHQIERQALLLDPSGGPTTIEREYLVTLILHLADPGNLTARQVEWIAARLHEWCRPLRLALEPTLSTSFYVDIGGSAGLRRRTLGPLGGRVLFVDTEPLHATLQQNRAALEQALRSEPLSENAPEQREQLALTIKIASRVDPEFKPLARRGERAPASGAVDAIIGFTNISGFLHNERLAPTTDVGAERSFGNTMDLATFGRTRTETDQQSAYARRRLAAFAAPGGLWEMKDISSSGFRLHAPLGLAMDVTLSMLVAIQRRGENGWVLGIVRRMRRLSADNAEIGLQLIANALNGAELVEHHKTRDADYSVNGEQAAVSSRRIRCLVLSFSRRAGEPAVQSLILPAVDYQPARRYALVTDDAERTVRFGRVVERHTDWIWTVIEPVDPGAPAATAARNR